VVQEYEGRLWTLKYIKRGNFISITCYKNEWFLNLGKLDRDKTAEGCDTDIYTLPATHRTEVYALLNILGRARIRIMVFT
jgi:hypothetical protein